MSSDQEFDSDARAFDMDDPENLADAYKILALDLASGMIDLNISPKELADDLKLHPMNTKEI